MYNSEEFISRCVRSLLQQLADGDELILVDDGSEDGTRAAAEALAEGNSKIVVVPLDKNQGVSVARNVGVAAATGDIVLFVDPDDEPDPSMLSLLRGALESTGATIAAGGYQVLDELTGTISSPGIPAAERVVPGTAALEMLCARELASSVCFMAFRRTFLDEGRRFRENHRFEDFIFLADYLADASAVAMVPTPVYLYRRRAGTETGRLNETAFDVLVGEQAAQVALSKLPESTRRSYLSRRLRVSLHVTLANQAAAFGDHGERTKRALRLARSGVRMADVLTVARAERGLAVRASLLRASPALFVASFRAGRRTKQSVRALRARRSTAQHD